MDPPGDLLESPSFILCVGNGTVADKHHNCNANLNRRPVGNEPASTLLLTRVGAPTHHGTVPSLETTGGTVTRSILSTDASTMDPIVVSGKTNHHEFQSCELTRPKQATSETSSPLLATPDTISVDGFDEGSFINSSSTEDSDLPMIPTQVVDQEELMLEESSTSIILSSHSFIARDWVTYIDELEDGRISEGGGGDDIQSLSGGAGSPDRSLIQQFSSIEERSSQDDIVTLDSLAEVVMEHSGRSRRTSSSVPDGNESESTPQIRNRPTIDLSIVSTILDQSFLSIHNAADHENNNNNNNTTTTNTTNEINRKIEGWDMDIKLAVTNLNLLHHFPRGLAFSTARKCRSFHRLRLWFVDNNSATCQGSELRECLEDHIQISETIEISSVFCLLNSLQQVGEFSVSSLSGEFPFSLQSVSSLSSPSTLSDTKRIHDDAREEMNQMIQKAASQKSRTDIPWGKILRDAGRQAEPADSRLDFTQQTIVVCIVCDKFDLTDDVASELFLLQRLPISIVIRLVGTTGREAMILELKSKLELIGLHSVRVFGDLRSHQILTKRANPWLNYAIPLHRYQEMGLQSRTISLLETRCLNHYELREFLVLLFGRHVMLEAPDLEFEWPAFLRYIKFVNQNANKHWDGVTLQTVPWLDIAQLDHMYGTAKSHSFDQDFNTIREQSRYSGTQVEL